MRSRLFRRTRQLASAAVLAATLLAAAPTAQEYRGTIVGIVTDTTGGRLAGATVTLRHEASNVATPVTTSNEGRFQFPYVAPGLYAIGVELEGFARLDRTGLVVLVGQRIELDLVLEAGGARETLDVRAKLPVLDTGSADLGTVVDQSYLERQPVAIRNVMNVVSVAPGVVGGAGSYGTAAQKDFSINGGGSGRGANEVLVDGLSVVLPRDSGSLGNVPLTEAVQEFRVHTTLFDAALGRSNGGAVSIVTRGGSNELRGSSYYYWRPHALRANTWTNNRNNQPLAKTDFTLWGGVAGGPVRVPGLYDGRDRSFWFATLERDDDIRSQTWQGRVPTELERQGDFSQTLNTQGRPITIYDPLTTTVAGGVGTRRPFEGNRIPSSRIDPTGRALLAQFPLPNVAGAPARIAAFNWQQVGNVDVLNRNISVRLDHVLSSRHRLMGRVGSMRREASPRNVPPGMSSAPPTGSVALDTSDRRFYSVSLNDDFIIGPSSVGTVRVGFVRARSLGATGAAGRLDTAALSLPAVIADRLGSGSWPTFTLGENLLQFGGNASLAATDSIQVTSSVTRLVRTHTLAAGGEWRVGRHNSVTPAYDGSFTYNNTFTRADPFAPTSGQTSGTAMASLLLGLPASGSFGTTSALSLLNHYGALYVKDDWQVSPRLTLNLGVRWELETPWKERYDRISYGFDPAPASPLVVPGLDIRGGIRFPGEDERSRYQGPTDLNNLGPRVGFAWKLTERTVVRGGFGIFYSTGSLNSNFNGGLGSFNAVTPYVGSVDSGATPAATLRNPFPNGLVEALGRADGLATQYGNAIAYFDDQRVLPYTQQWQIGVQRELPWATRVQVAYVGSHAVKQFESFNLNEVPDAYRALGTAENLSVANPFFGVLRPTSTLGASRTTVQRQFWLAYPQYTSITVNGANTGRAKYHGVQTSLEKRFSDGISFMVNYAYSRTIDNNTTSLINDRRFYQTVSALDQTHVIRVAGNWDLPLGPGRRFAADLPPVLRTLAGGWSISARYARESGVPLSISHPNGRPLVLRDPSIGGSVGDRLGDVRDASTGLPVNPYFDITAFAPLASPYEISPVPPVLDALRGPPSAVLDASLTKEVPIRGRLRAALRIEGYAITNSPIFSAPGTNLADQANFGVISSVGGALAGRIIGVDGARVVQVAVEVRF